MMVKLRDWAFVMAFSFTFLGIWAEFWLQDRLLLTGLLFLGVGVVAWIVEESK